MVVNSTNQERGYNHCRVMADVQSKKRRPNFSDEELHAPLHSEIPPLLVITFVYLTSKQKEKKINVEI